MSINFVRLDKYWLKRRSSSKKWPLKIIRVVMGWVAGGGGGFRCQQSYLYVTFLSWIALFGKFCYTILLILMNLGSINAILWK